MSSQYKVQKIIDKQLQRYTFINYLDLKFPIEFILTEEELFSCFFTVIAWLFFASQTLQKGNLSTPLISHGHH